MSTPEARLAALGEELALAAGRGGEATDLVVRALIPVLHRPLAEAECRRLLDPLRAHRRFAALCRLADALLAADSGHPYVHRQYAQGLIEQGQLSLAARLLRELAEDAASEEVRSEALGLLGRVHKQRFVTWADDLGRAGPELLASLDSYRRAYDLDPAWHGANLVALLHRGRQDGLRLPDGETAGAAARQLLRDLDRTPREEWNPWMHAAAGEAALALEDWPASLRHYGRFARHPDVDGFAIASAARQLREIWRFGTAEDHPGGEILAALEAASLGGRRGGELTTSPRELEGLNQRLGARRDGAGDAYEAILGDNAQVPLQLVIELLDRAAAVCQVVDRRLHDRGRPSGGTGFLTDGGHLHGAWAGRPVLVTNHHVLSDDGRSPSVRASFAEAVFHFYGRRSGQKRFRVDRILAHSIREELDFTVASLVDPQPSLAHALGAFSNDRGALGVVGDEPPARVYLVGHPQGRGIELSLSDNAILDHDLTAPVEPAFGCRRFHYRAPTENGMSGSPVFEGTGLEPVGLHRQGGEGVRPIRPAMEDEAQPPYRANEAVWGGSILGAVRGG